VDEKRKKRIVAYWLLTGVFMIVIQVLLGGITRLTGSGLSITEWKPIMGAVPPMNEQDWNLAFDKYKQIAQFKYVNSHFELDDFKFIFFWEWFHRLWARVLGVVFAIGFVYFLIKKYFDKDMILPLIILFILGAAQGLVGWIMVASGLNDTELYVNHIKLSLHFMAALLLLVYTLWFALQLLVPEERRVTSRSFCNFTIIVIVVLCIQLVYGAFMAGLKAAMSAPTWPSINGMWLPDTLTDKSLVNDRINVHFMHRQLAYLLLTLIIFWFAAASRLAKRTADNLLIGMKWWPFILVLVQVILGILTVVSAPKISFGKFGQFETLAEIHQLVAMFLLMALMINLYIVKPSRQ
jgi:cytochrome c oxidase assembly protein subunit 15